MSRYQVVTVTLAAVLGLAGCASGQEDPARAAAQRFVAAVADGDGDAVCGLLAPDTVQTVDSLREEGCAEAVTTLDLPHGEVVDVEVWGDAALAHTADDTVFLREREDGWRVAAAGCRSTGDGPYDCTLGGG